MAHFAELDSDNKVLKVCVVQNDVLIDENGVEQESLGIEFLNNLLGESVWKQCSYNGNFRGRFPAIGAEYLPDADVFSEVSKFPSWTLDRSTGLYVPPVPEPDYDPSTHFIVWREDTQEWVVIPNPPEYDRAKQRLQFDTDTLEWSVVEITEEPDTTN